MARRIAVLGVTAEAARCLERIHAVLAATKSRYVYECKRGRCSGYIEPGPGIDASTLMAALERSGLVLRDCGSGCTEPGAVLPPPPGSEPPAADPGTRGFVLGRAGGSPVTMEPEGLVLHTAILGATGAGKSHTAARIARCAAEAGYAVAVLDWHGEYAELLQGAPVEEALPSVNIVDPLIGLEEAVTIAEEALELTPQQAMLLAALLAARLGDASALESILATGGQEPATWTAKRIVALLQDARDAHGLFKAAAEAYQARVLSGATTKGELEVWTGLLRRLAMIGLDPGRSGLFALQPGKPTDIALKEEVLVVHPLNKVPGLRMRKLYATYLAAILHRYAAMNGTRLLIVLDEAQNLLPSRVLAEAAAEARKHGTGLLLVVHSVAELPEEVRANINTWVLHRTASREDLRHAAALIGQSYAETLTQLEPGTAVIYTGPREPVLARIARVEEPCNEE